MYRALFVLSFAALAVNAPGVAARANDAEQAAQIRFQAMDTNRDGVISRSEWQGSARSFIVHDWNGDGQLSGEEVRIGGRRTAEAAADHDPNRYERNLSWTQESFNALDHNRDRRITRNEWHFDAETFRRVDGNGDGALTQVEFLEGDADDDRTDLFDDLDTNNNGRVERGEWHGSAAAFNRLDRNRDGILGRFEVVGGAEGSGDTWDAFANLDNDNSGTLSRNEWHWQLGGFDRRDANRDGVLTRQEFESGAAGAGRRADALSQTVQVDSQRRWTDAVIDVQRGDVLTFSANGEIQMSDNANDLATPAGSKTGRTAPDAPVLNQLAGGLLAKIGDYRPIFIGDRRSITVPVSGRLYLGVNDDHLPDNRGSFTVNVAIQNRTN